MVVPLPSAIGLDLDMLMHSSLQGRNEFRAQFFLPVIITMTIVRVILGALYIYPGGALNALLAWLAFGAREPVDRIGDRSPPSVPSSCCRSGPRWGSGW